MNFKTATTGDKLRFLAAALERTKIAAVFNQSSTDDCVVGIGVRLRSDGGLRVWRYRVPRPTRFAQKYGVTKEDANALFVAEYKYLGIGEDSRKYHEVTRTLAVQVLHKLALKYDRQQAIN